MKRKIVLFVDNLGSGGAQRQVVNIAILFKNSGYDVRVLVYQDIPFYKPLLEKEGVEVDCVQSNSNISRIIRVRHYLIKSGADAVIAFMETPCFIACLSKIGQKWKLITTERSAKLSTFLSRRNRFFNIFERFADAKVGNSENAMGMWRKYYPQYSDKYSVIYNQITIPAEYVDKHKKYLSSGKLQIIVAASYQELKNPIRVIEALKLLPIENRERLLINWYGKSEVTYGNTEIYDKAKELIEKYNLSNCIHLHEETDEIYRLMSESDVVGLFSTVEGLPNTICEAMTIGRPIIMSRVSDYSTLVSDNGVLCNPKNVNSIKNALEQLLSFSADDLEAMGKSSREHAKALFSEKKITKKWLDVIKLEEKEYKHQIEG